MDIYWLVTFIQRPGYTERGRRVCSRAIAREPEQELMAIVREEREQRRSRSATIASGGFPFGRILDTQYAILWAKKISRESYDEWHELDADGITSLEL